ncbi:MAG: hypothetical protein IMW98_03115 [Firmicutes bacterium]|nr:hypothetical protein [Bacillota bacterium]
MVKPCEICAAPMVLPPSVASRRRTCSRSCQARLLSAERRGSGNPNYRRGPAEWRCAFCGRPFADRYYVARRKYCCRDCQRLDRMDCRRTEARALRRGRTRESASEGGEPAC